MSAAIAFDYTRALAAQRLDDAAWDALLASIDERPTDLVDLVVAANLRPFVCALADALVADLLSIAPGAL